MLSALNLPNELIWIVFLLINLSVVVGFYRLMGRLGLYITITFSIVLCNIQVLKQVDLFGMHATLGNILYASIFLSTDLLGEHYGPKEASRGVLVGFAVAIIMAVYMQFALAFQPNANDFANPHLSQIFGLVPAIVIASLAAYLISQFHDVFMFDYLKKRTGGRHLWLRNNISTLVSQLLDSAVFVTLATLLGAFGQISFNVALEIFLTTYVIKSIVAVCDTPFIYFATYLCHRQNRTVDPDGITV